MLPQPSLVRTLRLALGALIASALSPCTSLSSRFPSFCSIFSTSCRWLPLLASLLRASLWTFRLKAFALMYGTCMKRTCRQKLAPLLRLGFNAPCLSFRHQPVLLWDPWLRPSECPWYGAGGERASVQREDEVEASVCQLASTYLGLPPQGAGSGIGAFQRFMREDRCALCRLSFRVQANDDALTRLPVWNHDLGGSAEYDEAVLWPDRALLQTVWYPHIGHSHVPACVRAACPRLPAPGQSGSFLLLYIQHFNVGAILVCWEAASAILGSPLVCLCSCFGFRYSGAVPGHENATKVDDMARLRCCVCCSCCSSSAAVWRKGANSAVNHRIHFFHAIVFVCAYCRSCRASACTWLPGWVPMVRRCRSGRPG
eukprot:s1012_g4.t1